MDQVIIICSTPYSKRLPAKCFLKIAGKPALQHIFDRIEPLGIPTILAIPWDTNYGFYDQYLEIAKKYPFVIIERGDDNSPLHRMSMILGMMTERPKYVIRITHDDIIIDWHTINDLLAEVEKQGAGYGITPSIIRGADAEVIATENILYAASMNRQPVEHISYFVKGQGCPNPEILLLTPREAIGRDYNLTLDYYEDFVVLETILRRVGVNASVDRICEYLDEMPYILNYNKRPEFSIYTCVRNGSQWVKETMFMVLQNTKHLGANFEYIVVDDASTDSTLEKVLWFADYKNLEIIVNEKNEGLSSSSNLALSQAKGEYVMRVDVDDVIKPNVFEVMKEEMEKRAAVICYANYDEIDEKGQVIRKNVSAKENHHAGCALVHKRWLNEVKFKEGLKYWDSLELYNRIKDKFPIAYIDRPLWRYRIHKNSLSRSNLEERKECKPK